MRQEENGPVRGSEPIRVPPWAFPMLTVVSILIGVTAVVRGTSAIKTAGDSDLITFFFPAAQNILLGHPLHIYAVNAGGYPNYNPPLSIFLMAPLLKLAETIGFAQNYGEQITFVTLPFIVLVPLLGYMVVRALRRLYPAIPDAQLLLAYALIVLSPLTWQSIATWYHVEQPLMLCLLIGAVLLLRQRHEELAGVLAGLAVLSRTTALMPLIALGMLLLLAREWRSLLRFAGVAGGLVLVVMAPFFIADPHDATYSLLSWRSGAPIGGNTVWAIFSYEGTNHLLHQMNSAARRLDMYVVVLFIVIVTYLAWRRWQISAFGTEVWALLAVALIAVPMLSKTNWPYYYLEPFVFLLIWEFASMHDRISGVWRWPVLALCFLAVTATLSQYVGLVSVGYGDRVLVGVTSSGAMFAFVLGIWARLDAKKSAVARVANGQAVVRQPGAPYAPAIAPAMGTTSRVPSPRAAEHGPYNPPGPASVPWGAQSPVPGPPTNYGQRAQGSAEAPLWPPGASYSRQPPKPPSPPLWPPEGGAPPGGGAPPPSPRGPAGAPPGARPDRNGPNSRWMLDQ
jgi:hypothetical protein